jgi:tetratricopeptide (TPR) repeat protein
MRTGLAVCQNWLTRLMGVVGYIMLSSSSSKPSRIATHPSVCGTAYVGLHNYEEAIKAFNIAIDLKPDFYWSRLNRAKALVAIGRNQSAVEDYQYLIKRDPTNQELIHSLDALTVTIVQKPDVKVADQTSIAMEREGACMSSQCASTT